MLPRVAVLGAITVVVTTLGGGCSSPPGVETQTPYELGREALKVKDFTTASTQLNVAINSARDFVFTEAYLERAECHLLMALEVQGDATLREQGLKQALDDLQVVLRQEDLGSETEIRARCLVGKTHLARGDVQGAEKAFQDLLEVGASPEARKYQLEAFRELGWILFDRARALGKNPATAEEELAAQEEYRRAQERFSQGLELEPLDEGCNLGKGISLRARGQDGDAIGYLEKCVTLTEARTAFNFRGHYHLALALERQKGYQEKSLEHYRRAIEQDTQQTFLPLYQHLVEVLLVYVPFEDPQFSWFFDHLLGFAGSDPGYWSSVEAFGESLRRLGTPAHRESGLLARAVARARNNKVDGAVEDALELMRATDGSLLLGRVFPNQPRRPEFLYGRAMVLYAAKRHQELAAFFEDPIFRSTDPAITENEAFQKALVIEGKNIVALWLEQNEGRDKLTDEERTRRDAFLARAREAFLNYHKHRADDVDVALALGAVQELLEEYSKASAKYAEIAKANPANDEAFRRLVRLHEGRLLNPLQVTEAWIALLGYTGQDHSILDYVKRTEVAVRQQALLYCQGCGRKGSEGDVFCLECGRKIGIQIADSGGAK